MPQLKMKKISLTTIVTNDGDFCVRRKPATMTSARAELDVVRLSNDNPPDASGNNNITVSISPAEAAKLFDPIPTSPNVLTPGSSVDWTVKASLPGPVSVNYQTEPDNCEGQDQGDIIVQ